MVHDDYMMTTRPVKDQVQEAGGVRPARHDAFSRIAHGTSGGGAWALKWTANTVRK